MFKGSSGRQALLKVYWVIFQLHDYWLCLYTYPMCSICGYPVCLFIKTGFISVVVPGTARRAIKGGFCEHQVHSDNKTLPIEGVFHMLMYKEQDTVTS